MLQTADEIRERVKTGIDLEYLRAKQKMGIYMLTGEWKDDRRLSGLGDALWPWFEDYTPSQVEIGRSKRILNASKMVLSRVPGSDIEPESPDVDKYLNGLRKGSWKKRAQGDDRGDGGWDVEMTAQFLDFRELGSGCIYHGTKTDENGYQYATNIHVRATDVVYDRSVRNPLHARWVCVRFPIPYEEALATDWDKKKVESAREYVNDKLMAYPLPVVYCHYYFDVGIGGKEPTRAVWIGHTDGPFVEREENIAGHTHVSWGVGMVPPGARWPLGGVYLQAATQAMLNSLEHYFKAVMNRIPLIGVDESKIAGNSLEKALRGETRGIVKFKDLATGQNIQNLFTPIPGGEATQTVFKMWEIYTRQDAEDGGLSEIDRGNALESQRTLGEVQQVQNNSAANRGFDERQTVLMQERTVKRTFDVMKHFDRAPFEIMVKGQRDHYLITLNDPSDPRTWMDKVFSKPSEVVVDPGAVTGNDMRMKTAKRIADLANIAPMVGKPGGVRPEKMRDELLNAIGEPDVQDWAMPDQMAMLQQTLNQMPQQGGAGGPMPPMPQTA